jgi:penicillin-binding protein 2
MSHDPFEHLDPIFGASHGAKKNKYAWVEETFDVGRSDHKEISTSQTNMYVGTIITRRIFWRFIGIVGSVLFLILVRIFYVQIILGSHYTQLSESNRMRVLPIVAERGIIYDRFGKQLVENIPSFSVSVVPQSLPSPSREPEKRAAIIKRIAELAEISPEQVEKIERRLDPRDSKRASAYQSLTIKENLDYVTALKIYRENSDLPGISIDTGFKRKYATVIASSTTASSTSLGLSSLLGYLGKINETDWKNLKSTNYLLTDSLGKEGVEKTYASELRGVYGKRIIEVDANDREQAIIAVEKPVSGKNITLTIDAEAQARLQELLARQIEVSKKKRGAALAMNSQTGEIIAMVNYPTFDNNDFSGGISHENFKKYNENPNHPLFNRVIGGELPPGSTLKTVIAAAALEEHIITPQTTFNSTGGVKLGLSFFPDWKAGGHGLTNVTKALAWSVNTFFYYVGGGSKDLAGLGLEKIRSYMQLFGLGERTGIDLPGEATGLVPSAEYKKKRLGESWYQGDTYNISIGQGDTLATPLQVAVWTSVFINEGKRVVPHVVMELSDPSTHVKEKISSRSVKEHIVSEVALSVVKQGMRECVTYGSCQRLKNLPFTSGGKTGTAQWSYKKGEEPHAWFAAFAPFEHPQIVVVVLVEEGKEGSTVALPVAYDFLAWWGKKYLTR